MDKEETGIAGDGMPDGWEVKYGLKPTDATDATGSANAAADLDGDGLTNRQEYEYAMPNGWSLASNGAWWGGAKPDRMDTDLDFVIDGDEVNLKGSSPLSNDTDGDSFRDNYDVRPTIEDHVPTIENITSPTSDFTVSVLVNASDASGIARVGIDAYYDTPGGVIIASEDASAVGENSFEFRFNETLGRPLGFNASAVDHNGNTFAFEWIYDEPAGPPTPPNRAASSGVSVPPTLPVLGCSYWASHGGNVTRTVFSNVCPENGGPLGQFGSAQDVRAIGIVSLGGIGLLMATLVADHFFDGQRQTYAPPAREINRDRAGTAETTFASEFEKVIIPTETWDRIRGEFPNEVTAQELVQVLEQPLHALAVGTGAFMVLHEVASYHGKGPCILRLTVGFETGVDTAHLDDFVRFCQSEASNPSSNTPNADEFVWLYWAIQASLPAYLRDYSWFFYPDKETHMRRPVVKMWTIYEFDAKSGQFGSSVVSALPGKIVDVCQNGAEFNPINVKFSVSCGLMMGQWSFEKLQCAKTGSSCASITSEKNYTQWYWGPDHAGQFGPFVDRRSMDAALTIDAIDLQSWGTVSYGWTLNWSHGPRDHLEISSIGRVADTEVCFDPASCIGVAEVLMGESEKKMETRGLTGYSAYLPAAVIFTYSGLGAYFEFAETPSEFRFGNRWAEGF